MRRDLILFEEAAAEERLEIDVGVGPSWDRSVWCSDIGVRLGVEGAIVHAGTSETEEAAIAELDEALTRMAEKILSLRSVRAG